MVMNSQRGGAKRLIKGAALSSFLTSILAGFSSPVFASADYFIREFETNYDGSIADVGNDFSVTDLLNSANKYQWRDIKDADVLNIYGIKGHWTAGDEDGTDLSFVSDASLHYKNQYGYGKFHVDKEGLDIKFDNVALRTVGKTSGTTQIEKATNFIQGNGTNTFSSTIYMHIDESSWGFDTDYLIGKGLREAAIVINGEYEDGDQNEIDRSGKVHIFNFASISISNELTQAKYNQAEANGTGYGILATKAGSGKGNAEDPNVLLSAVNSVNLTTAEDEAIKVSRDNTVRIETTSQSDSSWINIATNEGNNRAIDAKTGAQVYIRGNGNNTILGSIETNHAENETIVDTSYATIPETDPNSINKDDEYLVKDTKIDISGNINKVNALQGNTITADQLSNISLTGQTKNIINSQTGTAIVSDNGASVSLSSTNTESTAEDFSNGNIVQALNGTAIDGSNKAQVSLSSKSANYVLAKDNAINIASGANATITATGTNEISAEQIGVHVDGTNGSGSSFNLNASTNTISAGLMPSGTTISTMSNNQPVVGIDMTGGKGTINSDVTNVYASSGTTPTNSGLIDLDNLNLNTVGIKLVNNANLTVSKSEQSGVSTFAARNTPEASAVVSDSAGVYVEDSYYESKQAAHIIRAGATNTFANSTTQAFADWNRILDPTSDAYNELINSTNSQVLANLNAASTNGLLFGDNIAINSVYTDSEINTGKTLRGASYKADLGNTISGAVIADSRQEEVDFNNINQDVISIVTDSGNNYILSSAIIKDATATSSDTSESEIDKTQVHTAVYALGEESEIKIENSSKDGWNFIMTNAPKANEHVVRASNGGDVTISGNTFVSANANYNDEGFIDNNVGLALVAGTADGQDESLNEIKVNADNGNNYHTYIFGDVAAGHSGSIQISNKDSEGATFIRGNVLAANGGSVDLNLGESGIWIGRGDDYGDASNGSEHGNSFYNPAFSRDITNRGTVNVTMGTNSKWYLTGQSWISSLTTTGTADIYMSNKVASTTDELYNESHALLIGTLSGGINDATFHMTLNHNDHSLSDMLYIREVADGVSYKVNILGSIEGFDDISEDKQLRFATIKGNSSVFSGKVDYDDRGLYNHDLIVNAVEHVDNEDEDTSYNGNSLDENKPGDNNLDSFFDNNQAETATLALAAKQDNSETLYDYYLTKVTDEPEDPDPEDPDNPDTPDPDNPNPDEPVNPDTPHGPVLSDAAQSVINMSRANYATAVYMDTLNKRQGEARFANGSDNGVWVRLRHDNIGKDNSFRTHDTMVEVGFDQGIALESGSLHTGVAFDYMNGQIDYHTVDGDGDIDRYGVWFYTTYLGNNGQYADLVLKYGHLKNDFGFNTKSLGEHVSGDYSNDVASISAEYGWKFSNSNNYYIEPQAQLQYSYVTGADYTTSQGTKVELESIHSLIGRVGFRAGKDFNTETPITAYIRGDVLHEFLGDQDIYASDPTGVMDVTYENDDTWYSAGVGLSVQSSDNTYFFIEGEQVFGADNDNTYTVSGGFKHSF